MMRRHAELLCEHMGEERGCKEFRKHVTWYLKGFAAGGTHATVIGPGQQPVGPRRAARRRSTPTSRSRWPSWAPRGGARARRGERVVLPEGWLDDTDGTGCGLREDASETTGG